MKIWWTPPWVYDSKQIYWDLQQLNYDVKLMWIPSHVGISGNEVENELARQAVESSTEEILADLLIQCDLWSRSNHGLLTRRRRGAL
jgi:ribonuclease HI